MSSEPANVIASKSANILAEFKPSALNVLLPGGKDPSVTIPLSANRRHRIATFCDCGRESAFEDKADIHRPLN